jgi:hypothetical protein
MADPENWIDPLNGYKYDCFNPDVLMQMKVVNGRVVTPGSASYAVLVIPGKHPMNPSGTMSTAVLNKLKQLANAGAKIIIDKVFIKSFGGIKRDGCAIFENSFEKFGVKKDLSDKEKNKIAGRTGKIKFDIYFISNQTESFQDIKFQLKMMTNYHQF